MIAFRGKKRLGYAQIGLLWGFNSKVPTSIPAPFIWESSPRWRLTKGSPFLLICLQFLSPDVDHILPNQFLCPHVAKIAGAWCRLFGFFGSSLRADVL